jgi:DnaJ-class molecular chaperone
VSPGHLIFVIEELKDKKFERRKNDLYTNIVVTLKEALLGIFSITQDSKGKLST